MKIKTIVIAFLFLFLSKSFVFTQSTSSIVEFSTNLDWVELANSDSGSTVSLTGWKLKVISYNGDAPYEQSLDSFIPRRGLLTFTLDGKIPADSGTIQLIDSSNNIVSSVTYGNIEGSDVSAPSTSQTAWHDPSAVEVNWFLTDDTHPITRGWCNPSGFEGCPTIASIVSQLTSSGITTNLGDMIDYTHVTGLYFSKDNYGKITFNNEINFTDKDTLSWMQDLNSKLDLSTLGKIALDADLVRNLINTQASLTMYNLSLNNPEVYVDGVVDSSGVVSNLSYSNGVLTFTAAHFTTFTAREKTSSGSSQSSGGQNNGASICTDQAPGSAPVLFQIDKFKTSAVIYFVPAKDPVSYYYISYGEKNNPDQYRLVFNQGYSGGVLKRAVNLLKPGVAYTFKVRSGNGCMPGPWSNSLIARYIGKVYLFN